MNITIKKLTAYVIALLLLSGCGLDTNTNIYESENKIVSSEEISEDASLEEPIIESESVEHTEKSLNKGTFTEVDEPVETENTFEEAEVVRVVDGDTIVIDRGNGDEKLRLILVDTPETVHPQKPVEYFGKEASNFTKDNLDGKTVYLEKDVSDTDRYNRLLRYVWLERPSSNEPTDDEIKEKCFNAKLLSGGYANVATFPPDLKYLDLFRELEKEVRESNKGLWAGGDVEETSKDSNNHKSNQNNKNIVYAYTEANGRIIGNKNSKIYHLPSGRNYKKTHLKNAVFFDTEEEAQNAGYRKAKQ